MTEPAGSEHSALLLRKAQELTALLIAEGAIPEKNRSELLTVITNALDGLAKKVASELDVDLTEALGLLSIAAQRAAVGFPENNDPSTR